MSFFFRRNQESTTVNGLATHQSDIERLRGRQLASLARAGGQAINREQTQFEVTCRLTDRVLVFIITLPDRFPRQPPLVVCKTPTQHPWLDQQMRVIGHPDLNAWSAHSDLGRIVSEIQQQFMRYPPTSAGQASGSASQYPGQRYRHEHHQQHHPPPPAHKHHAQSPPYPQRITQQSMPNQDHRGQLSQSIEPQKKEVHHTQSPAIPHSFPELDGLSESELENLLNDKAALKAFARKMDSVVNFLKLHDELVNGNEILAKANLEQQEPLEELKKLVAAQKTELEQAMEELKAKQAEQQQILANFQPRELIAKVRAAAKEADDESEELVTKFLDGNLPLADFIDQYLSIRQLHYLRQAKVDRFASA